MQTDINGKELHPDDVNSIVRSNLMNDSNYSGYCPNNLAARVPGGCNNPRTVWQSTLNQWKCPNCGWISSYPDDFIVRYKDAHGLK